MFYIFFFAAVLVEFEQALYTISEVDMSRNICVVLNGSIAVAVPVNISLSTGGTAGSSDFEFLPLTLTFTPNSSQLMCVGVAVRSDDVIEGNEEFSLTLSSDAPGVVLNIPETTIVIQDSTQTTLQLVTTDITLTEGMSGLICFNASLERNISLQINIESAGGKYWP